MFHKLFFLSTVVSFSSLTICHSQTLALKIGNAVQYEIDPGGVYIRFASDSIASSNGNTYIIVKKIFPHPNASTSISYERISGDTAYYCLSGSGTDSLLFNFKWQVGTNIKVGTFGSNQIFYQRLDSIKQSSTLGRSDTVYVIKQFIVNIQTGDTGSVLPHFLEYSKLFGALRKGMWEFMTGVKVNGIRTGEVLPFPDEVIFSKDTLYRPYTFSNSEFIIRNTSSYQTQFDSLSTKPRFPTYIGYRINLLGKAEENFFLFRRYPNDSRFDSLSVVIPPNDSLLFSILYTDLCPICITSYSEIFFTDSIRFVFSYKPDYIPYYFEKEMPISGYSRMSEVEDEQSIETFTLHQNYPNPFNSATSIKYSVLSTEYVSLKVYDILGREVATLVNEEKLPGEYEVQFKTDDPSVDRRITSGIYFYQLRTSEFIETKKMVYMK